MKITNFIPLTLMAGLFLFSATSCETDKDDAEPAPEKKSATIDATSYTDWVYFSFETGEIVTVTDFATEQTWDVGFHRWDVRTNGGMSGSGDGAALQHTETELDGVEMAPENGYVTDSMIEINMTGMPPVYSEHPANTELGKWMNLDMSQMPPVYTMGDNVYIVKTHNGNYAKLKFTDFTNDSGDRGHITFEYVLQTNGSREF